MIHLRTLLVVGLYILTDIPHYKIRQFFLVHLLCSGATGLTSPYYPFEAEGPFYLPSPKTFLLHVSSSLRWLLHLSIWHWRPITCKSRAKVQMYETLMPNDYLIHSSVQKYYMLASVVLLFYDLLTTLDIEIARIWSGKFSVFIVLWTLVGCLCLGLSIAPLTELTCHRTAGCLYWPISSSSG